MSETKVLTWEEVGNIIEAVAPNTSVIGRKFIIVEGWGDHKAIEEATGLSMNEVTETVTGNSDNWGFSDEYITCSDCGEVIKTSPDSYGWKPDFAIVNDCELLCGECIRFRPQDYLQDLINNPKKANTIIYDDSLVELGFKKITEDFEAGWYGRYDDPEKILERMEKKYFEVIFSITSNGQFSTDYVCWVRTPKYNLQAYMDDCMNKELFKNAVEKSISELSVNLKEYDYQIIMSNLISSGAGCHAGEEFLGLVGVDQYDIDLAVEQGYIHELVDETMGKLSEDLTFYCNHHDIDLKNHQIYVAYNDNDGAIDVFLSIDKDLVNTNENEE